MTASPYAKLAPAAWFAMTRKLVRRHPLQTEEIRDVVLASWDSIFDSRFGVKSFQIGVHIFPKPQIMGFLLHELIPLELQARYPACWRGDVASGEKDLVYVPDDRFSVEVKTSSNRNHIFGNRSYAQKTSKGKKAKSGYYLAVNFEKFRAQSDDRPAILLIRFGWLDSGDWIAQKAATGQQARLSPDVERGKLMELYRKS